MPSARQEARRFLYPLYTVDLLLLALFCFWGWAWIPLLVLVILTVYVSYFFRDPERAVPADPALIVAAADGLVVAVEEIDETDFQTGRCLRIAIFLSVFDVHVNRAPVNGRVRGSRYKPGEFLDVRHPECSLRNEHRAWLIETEHGPVVVRQIAGLIARRIVAWAQEGSLLRRGDRFGMIRFGSRTEVYLPLACVPLVKPGDRVAGASTPIARWP